MPAPRSYAELLMGAGMPGSQARVVAEALGSPALPLTGDEGGSPAANLAMNCYVDGEGVWRYLADGQAAVICLPRDDPMYIANAVNGAAGEPILEWVTVWEAPAIAAPANVEVPYVWQEGDVLSCTTGAWTGGPTNYAYLWLADGETAIGNEETYTLTGAEAGLAGQSITCTVTAANALGSTDSPPSNAIVVEAAAGDAEIAGAEMMAAGVEGEAVEAEAGEHNHRSSGSRRRK